MVKSNLLAEFAVSKDRLIQALACVSNLADRAVVQAIVHPKDPYWDLPSATLS